MDIDFSIILIAIASHDALFSSENSWKFKYGFIQPLKKTVVIKTHTFVLNLL